MFYANTINAAFISIRHELALSTVIRHNYRFLMLKLSTEKYTTIYNEPFFFHFRTNMFLL